MTLPSIDDLDSVGGPKSNLHAVVDPTTDEDAAHRNVAFADAVMATHTNTRAWVKLVTANGADPTLSDHDAVWGDSVAVQPVLDRTNEGIITITWPETVNDELEEEHAVNLRAPWASATGTTARFVQCAVTSPNVVTLYTFLANGTADDIAGETINVFVI